LLIAPTICVCPRYFASSEALSYLIRPQSQYFLGRARWASCVDEHIATRCTNFSMSGGYTVSELGAATTPAKRTAAITRHLVRFAGRGLQNRDHASIPRSRSWATLSQGNLSIELFDFMHGQHCSFTNPGPLFTSPRAFDTGLGGRRVRSLFWCDRPRAAVGRLQPVARLSV
jgi:hypothetical protein